MSEELDTALEKAKWGIIKQGSIFLSTIIFSMKHKWESSIPTAATNGLETIYNPDFFLSLSNKERIFVLAHEGWHVALDHLTRVGNKDFQLYNMAGDYVINQLLVDNGFTMPKKDGEDIGYQDNKYRGMSTEEVYALLEQDPSNKNKSSPMDGDIQETQDFSEEEQEKLKQHITRVLVKAKAASEMQGEEAGAIPGEIKRLIDKLTNPRLPWETLLQRFICNNVKQDYSWSKPNRRYLPEYYLPSLYSQTLGHIVIAIDTSGSLTDKQITDITREINGIHRKFKPEKLSIITCDYKIHDIYTVKPQEKIANLEFKGGGGTLFDPVFKYINDKKITPKLLIYFTDLMAKEPKIKPKYPVLWVCNSKEKPFKTGKTIYME